MARPQEPGNPFAHYDESYGQSLLLFCGKDLRDRRCSPSDARFAQTRTRRRSRQGALTRTPLALLFTRPILLLFLVSIFRDCHSK